MKRILVFAFIGLSLFQQPSLLAGKHDRTVYENRNTSIDASATKHRVDVSAVVVNPRVVSQGAHAGKKVVKPVKRFGKHLKKLKF